MPAITKRAIQAARNRASASSGEIILHDDLPGFYCRVQPVASPLPPGHPGGRGRGGKVSFGLRYRVRGPGGKWRNCKAVIAEYHPDTDKEHVIKEARTKAMEMRAQVAKGIDPAAIARKEREDRERAAGDTVEALAAEFVEKHAKANGNATWKETERIMRVYVTPTLGKWPVSSIGPKDVIDLLDDIADRKVKHPDTGKPVGGPVMANRVHSALHKMLRWAKRKHKIEANPAADLDKRRERKGTRTLTDGELRDLWTAADTLGYPAGHFVKTLLLTGRREAKVATMRRAHIDRIARVWTPADTSATKQSPELPLFTALETLLDTLPDTGKSGDYVFKQRLKQRHGAKMVTVFRDKPINSFNAIKRRIDAAIDAARTAKRAAAMPEWDLSRDVRRTVKTRLAELGVEKDLRDLILGHARTGMDAVYDHSKRREDKRAALERWGAHLARIVNPSPDDAKVIMLRAGG